MLTNVYTLQEPFSVGQKDITISDDPDLVGATCQANIFDEDNVDISGSSNPFKIIN